MNTFWGSFHVKAGRAVATQRAHAAAGLVSSSHHPSVSVSSGLQGKRVGMVTFSSYPADPRPRRAADALLKEGMSVDLVCLRDKKEPTREAFGVGIAMTVENPSPTSPRSSSGQRAAVVVPLSTR